MLLKHLYTVIRLLGVTFFAFLCQGCDSQHAQRIWWCDEEGATAVVTGRFAGEVDEIRVFVSEARSLNDFCRVQNPDVLMSKSPDYKTNDRNIIAEVIADFRDDSTYETNFIDSPRKPGDRFCTVLLIESKKKEVIYFRAGMPKGIPGSPVTIAPLYETNSVYSSAKVSKWLDGLFKREKIPPQND